MKKLITLLITFTVLSAVIAQSTDEQKKRIANIKKSNDYIYAEVTTTGQQQAIDLATELLYSNINEWVAKKKKFAGSGKIVTKNRNYSVEKITMPRADMYRAFMYVRKSDIIPADNATVTEVNKTPTSAVRPQVSKPAPVQPIASHQATVQQVASSYNSVVKALLGVSNTGRLSVLLKDLKNDNKISEYNNLRGLKGKNLAEYVMVIFNKDGVVEAVLSEGTNRKNLKTGTVDTMTNYKGCGAIGVKVIK